MLKNLSISNAAVAKNVNIDFEDGFTVITGETGSGKSVMIDCLQILSGVKSSKDIVRFGENKASVSAIFEPHESCVKQLTEVGAEPDEYGELSVVRSVGADGRTSAKINGKGVTVANLREIAPILLGINTQDEKVSLLDRSEYYSMLDTYAENNDVYAEYQTKFERYTDVKNELETLKSELAEKSMMTDILKYQIREIDSARLSADDEEDKLLRLRTKIKSLEKSEKSRKIIQKALAQNDKGYSVAYLLERASAALEQVSDMVEGGADMVRKLEEFKYEILDIAESVNSALDTGIEGDPMEKLTQIESRLNTIEKLKKKYGSTIKEIKAFREEAKEKLQKFTDSDETIASLEKTLKRVTSEAKEAADNLRASRATAAKTLSDEILATLKYLDMPKVRFYIEVLPNVTDGAYNFQHNGADTVDIKISVNPGEAPTSIAKVASGGEMSRVMLALRSALNKKNGAQTVIFDEIDAGVSGSTSERIGHMLKTLSKTTQVICVTHSPQIAALADYHYLISKHEVDGRAESRVKLLDRDERIEEIARIIGGIDVTDKQRAAALEMITMNVNTDE